MADLTITAGNVKCTDSTAQFYDGTSGEAISQGMIVFVDTADGNKLKKADSSTDAKSVVKGMALNTVAAADQPVRVLIKGDVAMGAILTAGEVYVAGAAGGGIAPSGDMGAGEYTTIVGVAKSTTVLALQIHVSGVAHG